MLLVPFLAACAGLAAAIPPIPTVPIMGLNMPIVGEGSCCGAYNISSYLENGGRHIDTSCDYGSQPTIAAAIAASGIPRNQLWITSKINVEMTVDNMTQVLYDKVLTPLNTPYVDLLLLHHAGRFETDPYAKPPCVNLTLANGLGTYYQCRIIALTNFKQFYQAGLVKSFGVSNFNVRDLLQAKELLGFFPAINQIEYHPYWQAREVVSFCNKNGILVEAYAPMGDGTRSNMLSDPGLVPIAAAHNVSIGQLVLQYNLQSGADIVIPRSHNPAHQEENLNLFNPPFSLSEEEIATVGSLKPYKKVYKTDCQPWC